MLQLIWKQVRLFIKNMFRFEKITILCILVIVLAYVCQYFYSTSRSLVTTFHLEYDFIIVGAGTAGCVLAARLSENTTATVLLIEAGDQFGYASKVPIMPTIIQRGSNDWSFTTEPQKFSSYGLYDQMQFLPRGKGLGGSGQLNYLLHATGLPSDFDMWVKMGAHGWKFSNVEGFIQKIFVSHDSVKNPSLSSKFEPVIRLSDIDEKLHNISAAFTKSSAELPSDVKMDVTNFKNTIFHGQRESSYKSYLLPNLNRENLDVLKNVLVTKILFDGKQAESVQILKDGKLFEIGAKREIIISAGSIQSPQLLMLSGIGPRSEMKKFGIEEIARSEGVGLNLHDHLNMPLYISIQKPLTMTFNKICSLKSIFSYYLKGQGYLASPGVVALGRGEGHAAIILFAMGSVDEVILREVANFKPEVFHSFFPFYKDPDKEGFIFLNTCLQPSSRGNIKLRSDNPTHPPVIDPNYLSNISDVECIIKAIRLTVEVLKTPTLKNLGAVLHWPMLDGCSSMWNQVNITDDYLECIIRFGALTGHHAAGTCSMAGESSVVDSSLKVRGVQKLSVVDASILPTPVSSPPNSVIIAIAERAAHIIKERHNYA